MNGQNYEKQENQMMEMDSQDTEIRNSQTFTNETLNGEALLTAIALGEALPEECAQFEAERNVDGELNEKLLAELDAIRKLAQELTLTLAQEPLPEEMDGTETPNGQENTMNGIENTKNTEMLQNTKLPKKPSRKWRVLTFSTCTAALLLILCAGFLVQPEMRQTADLMRPLPSKMPKNTEIEPAAEAETTAAGYSMDEAVPEYSMNEAVLLEELPEEEAEEFDAAADETAAAPAVMAASERSVDAVYAMPSGVKKKSAARSREILGTNRAEMQVKMQAEVLSVPESRRMSAPEPELPAPMPVPRPYPTPTLPPSAPQYVDIQENEFKNPAEAPYSTFGLDTDSASYSQMRTFLTENEMLPPRESIRVEEYVNYFNYELEGPAAEDACPLRPHVEVRPHPWREGLLMAMVAVKGREIPEEKRPKLNLVFLIDVSGSMSDWNKMPLVRDGMFQLLDKLRPEDRISIVTYASDTQVRLAPTPGNEKSAIEKVLLELNPYGSTAGGDGLQKAYALARENFDPAAVNRIILCSDGDFNVGMTDPDALKNFVEREAKSGVFLSVLGFGMGNFHDDRMKTLAASGNGNYAYVDSRSEAKKVLADDLVGSMVPIAKDVKLQIEFNPARVAAYRLIGYERRKLEDRDFHDDRKDSGEIGAGHCAVALYELVPVGTELPMGSRLDPPRYGKKADDAAPAQNQTPDPAQDPAQDTESQTGAEKPAADGQKPEESETAQEWFFVKLRWKEPNTSASTLHTFPVTFDAEKEKETPPSANFRFASGTALFALILRDSPHTGSASLGTVLDLIQPTVGEDPHRTELQTLVEKAQRFIR